MADTRIAVVGAGIIGKTHIKTLARCDGVALSAIVDPSPAATALAGQWQVPLFADIDRLVAAKAADAVIVASPNETHVEIATRCLEAGLPVLLEKPAANTIAEGALLEDAVERTGVPLLVGHQRRHNPLIKAAKAAIDSGAIGDLVMANVITALMKPDDYFDVPWRTEPGQGGPLLINLIHEVDILRNLFGEIVSVRAMTSNAIRGFAVEDSAAAILAFERGGMATMIISDAAVGPWSWELTSGENPARFPAHDTLTHMYAGTAGGLSLPDLALWRHSGARDWTRKLAQSRIAYDPADSYVEQLRHFGDVIHGRADPLVSCRDGIANMQVIEAIKAASATGAPVVMSEFTG